MSWASMKAAPSLLWSCSKDRRCGSLSGASHSKRKRGRVGDPNCRRAGCRTPQEHHSPRDIKPANIFVTRPGQPHVRFDRVHAEVNAALIQRTIATPVEPHHKPSGADLRLLGPAPDEVNDLIPRSAISSARTSSLVWIFFSWKLAVSKEYFIKQNSEIPSGYESQRSRARKSATHHRPL